MADSRPPNPHRGGTADDARRELAEVRALLQLLAERLDRVERRIDDAGPEAVGALDGPGAEQSPAFAADIDRPTAPVSGDAGGSMAGAIEAVPTDEPPEPGAEPGPAARSPLDHLLERRRGAARAFDAPESLSSSPRSSDADGEHTRPARARRGPSVSDLEWLVGAKGIVLAGVLILVIAAGLFLKEAWDRGWFAGVPDWVRCVAAAGFGLGMMAVGEVVRRRINPLASSGVSAAGLAIVFGAILAAARLYGLLPTPVAFALLALTSVAGVVLGAVSRRVLLAGLSLVGSFVVPVVLSTGQTSYVIVPAYLLSLLAMGLALAGWKGSGYAVIRRMAWWGTALLGTAWAVSTSRTSAASPAIFTCCVWALTIAELAISSRFFGRFRPSVPWPPRSRAGFLQTSVGDPITLDLRELLSPEARWVNTSFGVSAWAAVLGAFAVHRHAEGLAWIFPAGLLLLSVMVAMLLSPDRPRLWASASTPRSALATAMILNATGLLAVTIAMGLGGPAEVVAWALLGLAAVVFGRRMRFHASSVLGLAFVGFALARLLTLDLAKASMDAFEGTLACVTALGLQFSAWSAQLALVASTLVGCAILLRRSPYRVVVGLAAVAAAGLTVVGPGSSLLSVGAFWAIYSVALAFFAVRLRRPDIRIASLVPLAVGTLMIHGKANALILAAPAPDPDRVWIAWTDASWALLIVAASAGVWTLRRGLHPLPRALGVIGAVWSIAVALVGDGLPISTTLVAWSMLAGLLTALASLAHAYRRARLHRWLLPHLALAFSVFLSVLWFGERAATGWGEIVSFPIAHRAIVSAMMLIAVLVATGGLVGVARRVPLLRWDQRRANRVLRTVAWSAAGVLGLVASSSEIGRVARHAVPGVAAAPNAALSVWWSFFAVATIGLGVRAGGRGGGAAIRWAGLGLLAVTGVKVLMIDMAALDGLTRIAGSAVVGLVMLAAGVGYAWMMGRATPASPRGDAQ